MVDNDHHLLAAIGSSVKSDDEEVFVRLPSMLRYLPCLDEFV